MKTGTALFSAMLGHLRAPPSSAPVPSPPTFGQAPGSLGGGSGFPFCPCEFSGEGASLRGMTATCSRGAPGASPNRFTEGLVSIDLHTTVSLDS